MTAKFGRCYLISSQHTMVLIEFCMITNKHCFLSLFCKNATAHETLVLTLFARAPDKLLGQLGIYAT